MNLIYYIFFFQDINFICMNIVNKFNIKMKLLINFDIISRNLD